MPAITKPLHLSGQGVTRYTVRCPEHPGFSPRDIIDDEEAATKLVEAHNELPHDDEED